VECISVGCWAVLAVVYGAALFWLADSLRLQGEAKRCNVAFMSPRDLLAVVGRLLQFASARGFSRCDDEKGIQSWL